MDNVQQRSDDFDSVELLFDVKLFLDRTNLKVLIERKYLKKTKLYNLSTFIEDKLPGERPAVAIAKLIPLPNSKTKMD